MINMITNMVSYLVCGVCEVEFSDPVRHEPTLVAFSSGLDDVDILTSQFNALTQQVQARSVPLLTVDELCRMVELDTQIQKHRQ